MSEDKSKDPVCIVCGVPYVDSSFQEDIDRGLQRFVPACRCVNAVYMKSIEATEAKQRQITIQLKMSAEMNETIDKLTPEEFRALELSVESALSREYERMISEALIKHAITASPFPAAPPDPEWDDTKALRRRVLRRDETGKLKKEDKE